MQPAIGLRFHSSAMEGVVRDTLWPVERGPAVGSTRADVYGD